jgi:RHH-type proline utilization regulon transcriptional repressor/proline dehydrogenase/delta 1-pyrroline-5-carboxylate dehydrogenase
MPADLESQTQRIGREIFARCRRHRHASGGWWDRWLMDRGMRDPRVKAQLFRFIDVLPVLADAAQVNGHLCEYLSQVRPRLPGLLNAALDHWPHDGWMGRRLAEVARWNARHMARRFIAAADLPQAIQAVDHLGARRLGFTIDLLGEAVLSETEAERYQQRYLELIEHLGAQAVHPDDHDGIPRINVSIKLSGLYSQFDPIHPRQTSDAVRQRLRPILRAAMNRGALVNFDMEQYAFKDLTLRIFREVLEEAEFRAWGDVGIAVQAYLRDCGDDLAALARWAQARGTPVWVRLVKGAYWDYEMVIAAQNGWPAPVFTDKADTDANFETQTRFLIAHHDALRPAIATHNIRSIAAALACAAQIPPGGIEFQMLYGMADDLKTALVEMGQRVRVYTPVGQLLPGMAYLVRRLLENTSNESFLRAEFVLPEEQLLMNPLEILHRQPARPPGPKTPEFVNEPPADFSRDDARRAMQEALAAVGGKLGAYYPAIVDGQRLQTAGSIESMNPSHRQQVVGRAGRALAEHAQAAVAAAKSAFPAWRDTPARERADLLFKAAGILRRRRFELAAWEVYETAKQWREADGDVAEAIDYCEYYGHEMLRLAEPRRHDVSGEDNEYFYEGRGVAVVIAPWNFPLAILCGMSAAALVAGNTVILKPAEQSPIIGAMWMQVLQEAGFPAGVVHFLPGLGEEIGPALVDHPDVAVIAFTGSRAVGLAIQSQAARTPPPQDHLKRVITEMGGKNAIIIDADADLDEAVHGVVASAFGYAGQKCSACSRVIVPAAIHDIFLARLVEATRSLTIGPAEDPGAVMGPLIDEDARRRVLEYVQTGQREAKLVYAADVSALADEGFYVGPHIFAGVSVGASIAQEEIFGPVLAVLKAADLAEAIEMANATPYALTGGLYSRSPANIARVRREFRVGNLYINRRITGALVDRQPFGGFKLSGPGSKAGGPDYVQQFLLPRTITENTLRHGFAPGE